MSEDIYKRLEIQGSKQSMIHLRSRIKCFLFVILANLLISLLSNLHSFAKTSSGPCLDGPSLFLRTIFPIRSLKPNGGTIPAISNPGTRIRDPLAFNSPFFRTGLTRETKEQKSKWSVHNLYFAHLAITDESKKKFDYQEKIHRGSLGEAGATPYAASEKTFRIWIEDWLVEGRGLGLRDHFLKAGDKDFGIEFTLTPEKESGHPWPKRHQPKGRGRGIRRPLLFHNPPEDRGKNLPEA